MARRTLLQHWPLCNVFLPLRLHCLLWKQCRYCNCYYESSLFAVGRCDEHVCIVGSIVCLNYFRFICLDYYYHNRRCPIFFDKRETNHDNRRLGARNCQNNDLFTNSTGKFRLLDSGHAGSTALMEHWTLWNIWFRLIDSNVNHLLAIN